MAGHRALVAAALVALALGAAGCADRPPAAPEPEAPPAGAGDGSPQGADPLPPPNATQAPSPSVLWSWSTCDVRAVLLHHRMDAAAPFLPAGYRQDSLVNPVGNSLLMALSCAGAGVGDRFVPGVTWAFYGVNLAEAPGDGVEPGRHSLYLLDLYADPEVAEALRPSIPAARAGSAALGGVAWSVDSEEGAVARATMADSREADRSGATVLMRFHWRSGGLACWADVEMPTRHGPIHETGVEALGGHLRAIAAPAGVLAGVGDEGQADGAMASPRCSAA